MKSFTGFTSVRLSLLYISSEEVEQPWFKVVLGTCMNPGNTSSDDSVGVPLCFGVPLFYREEGLTSTNMHKETVVFRTWKRSVVKIFYPTPFPGQREGSLDGVAMLCLVLALFPGFP